MGNLFNLIFKNSIFFIFLFFLFSFQFYESNFFNSNYYKNCNELDYEESLDYKPEKFGKFNIVLKINDKKFSKILISNFNDLSRFNYVKYKKTKSKASILIELNENTKCYLKVKLRPHGDYADHYNYSSLNKFRLPSLRVEVENSHIFGIVEFILFRPETRKNENEVFITTLFSELGYLAPRTSFVNVTYKGKKENMIFQEVINKEFLENNQLVEGPILSGDERFVFESSLPSLSYHKIDNKKWIKNTENYKVSKHALEILNTIYQYHNGYNQYDQYDLLREVDMVDFYTITKNTNLSSYFNSLTYFDSLSAATLSFHGLSRDDRRYYFDEVNKSYIPILYDSGSELDSNSIFALKNNVKERRLIPSMIYGAKENIKKIKNININKLKLKLINYGFPVDDSNIENRLFKIMMNLHDLNSCKLELEKGKRNCKSYKIEFQKKSFFEKEYYGQEYEYFFKNTKLVFSQLNGYISCDITLNHCEDINLDFDQKKSLISQSFEFKKDECEKLSFKKNTNKKNYFKNFFSYYNNFSKCKIDNESKGKSKIDKMGRKDNIKAIYIGDKNYFQTRSYNDLDKIINSQYIKNFKINDNTILETYGNIKFNIDRSKKILSIYKYDENSNVNIKNGIFDEWTVNFFDKSSNLIESTYENIEKVNGLNGCLNFYDIQVKNIDLNVFDSKCEDGANFVRTKGSINSIFVKNSISDSLDFDFSNLNINYIEVINSKNDCVDFSYGKYKIRSLNVVKCGDKGISVGENSVVKIDDSIISSSLIGVASKDFSSFYSLNTNIFDVDTCVSAYNKKQEFSGGYIQIENYNCHKYKNNFAQDKQSQINIVNNDI